MKMEDVRVGMRLRCTGGSVFTPITVTEITPRGFKYRLDHPVPHIAREGSYFPVEGHEHFGVNGEALYELEVPAMMRPVADSIWRDHWRSGRFVRVVGWVDPFWVSVTWCNEDGSPTTNTRRYSKHVDLFHPQTGRFSACHGKGTSRL